MKRDPLRSVATAFGFVLLTIVALWLYSRYSEIRAAVIDQKKAEIAARVRDRVGAVIDGAVFTDGDSARLRQVLQSLVESTPEWVRIGVWDRNLTAIWTDGGESTEPQFPASRLLREAFKGDVGLAIERQITEPTRGRPLSELNRTYVPISDARGQIVAVFEVGEASSLREATRAQFQKAALPLGAFMFVGYGILVILLHMSMTPKSASPAAIDAPSFHHGKGGSTAAPTA